MQLDTPLLLWVLDGCPGPAPPLEDLTRDLGAQRAGLRHLVKFRKLRKVASPSRPACLLLCACSVCACWGRTHDQRGPVGTRPPGPCSFLGLRVPASKAGFVLVSGA